VHLLQYVGDFVRQLTHNITLTDTIQHYYFHCLAPISNQSTADISMQRGATCNKL